MLQDVPVNRLSGKNKRVINKTQVRDVMNRLRQKSSRFGKGLSNICVLSKDKEVNKSLSERVAGK